jgi:hypothetical protein
MIPQPCPSNPAKEVLAYDSLTKAVNQRVTMVSTTAIRLMISTLRCSCMREIESICLLSERRRHLVFSASCCQCTMRAKPRLGVLSPTMLTEAEP